MGSGPPDPLRETVTYGESARNLGDDTTAQEVGAAVGRNPVCILIPCHLVVGAGGKLTGFAGGLGRKRFLLDTERDVARPRIPRRPVMTAGMLSQDPGVAGTHPLARNADDPHWQPRSTAETPLTAVTGTGSRTASQAPTPSRGVAPELSYVNDRLAGRPPCRLADSSNVTPATDSRPAT